MSYLVQAQLANDEDMLARVAACAAILGQDEPFSWAFVNRWRFCAQPGWGDAYLSAVNAGVDRPGGDSAVISDAQIRAAVQAIMLPEFGEG